MTTQELEQLYRQRDFLSFDKLADELRHSFDEEEQREAVHYTAKSILVRRIYSGDTHFDEQVDFYKNILQYADYEYLNYKVSLAEMLIFQQQYQEAEDLLHIILAKARLRQDTDVQLLALAQLANLHIEQNRFREALQLVNESLEADAFEGATEVSKSEVYKTLVQALLRSQDFGLLEEYSLTLLEWSKELGDIEKEIIARNNLAIVNSIRHDYKNAMAYFLDALDLAIAINYRKRIADALINIGTIYANLQNHEEALSRYQTILEEYHDVLAINTLAIIYNNVGNIFFLLDDATQSKYYFEKSLEFASLSQYQEMIAMAHTQLSRTYRLLGNKEKAWNFAKAAQELLVALDEPHAMPMNLINLAYLSYDKGDFGEAMQLLTSAYDLAMAANNDLHMMSALRLMSEISAHQRDFAEAYRYSNEYAMVQDKAVKEQSRLQAIDIEIRYDIREKQQQIERLKSENAYQSQLLQQGEKIVEQNTQLLHANEELQQFAYIVSHDLKEPLRMVASYAQLIMFRYKDMVDENFQTYLDFISEGVTRMNSLLDGLLQYGTVGKEKEEKEMVDIQDAIESAEFNLKLLIRETQAIIEVQQMPSIAAHPSRMIQLFQNLINNALKFRNLDVVPTIKIGCEKKGRFYRFRVSDNGIGIEEEHGERIFAIFQRLHSRQKYEGTGIGLSICQKIVQHMGGQIWVESVFGEGSTFCFDLPIVKL